jgi:hypothetical protein
MGSALRVSRFTIRDVDESAGELAPASAGAVAGAGRVDSASGAACLRDAVCELRRELVAVRFEGVRLRAECAPLRARCEAMEEELRAARAGLAEAMEESDPFLRAAELFLLEVQHVRAQMGRGQFPLVLPSSLTQDSLGYALDLRAVLTGATPHNALQEDEVIG